jgi:hypothetical protein
LIASLVWNHSNCESLRLLLAFHGKKLTIEFFKTHFITRIPCPQEFHDIAFTLAIEASGMLKPFSIDADKLPVLSHPALGRRE